MMDLTKIRHKLEHTLPNHCKKYGFLKRDEYQISNYANRILLNYRMYYDIDKRGYEFGFYDPYSFIWDFKHTLYDIEKLMSRINNFPFVVQTKLGKILRAKKNYDFKDDSSPLSQVNKKLHEAYMALSDCEGALEWELVENSKHSRMKPEPLAIIEGSMKVWRLDFKRSFPKKINITNQKVGSYLQDIFNAFECDANVERAYNNWYKLRNIDNINEIDATKIEREDP